MRSQWDVFIGGHLPPQVSSRVPWSKLTPHSHRLFFVDRGIRLFPKFALALARQGYFFGDGDSRPLSAQKYVNQLPASHIHLYSRDKDVSDGEAALRFARKSAQASSGALFLGMAEGRPDHHLASLFQWLEIHPQGPWKKFLVLGPTHQMIFFQGRLHMPLPTKTPCALFRNPLDRGVRGLEIRGVRYPLSQAPLKSASHGISNQVVDGYIDVCGDDKKSHVLLISVPLKKLPKNFILSCL